MDPGVAISASRRTTHAATSTHLALLSDRRLSERLAAARTLGSGIGGRSAELEVDGARVFVKRIPLTDLELRHPHATANLFELPLFYHYGIGSAGFGAWRELAVHAMTTDWVLDGSCASFPLMYHWRVLPDSPHTDFVEEFGGLEGAVAHWDGSPAVRGRLEAIGCSTSSLVLFLEHVPSTLASGVPEWAEDALTRGTAFMSARGMVHFDAHFGNVLADDRQLYFADFGLALSSRFELAADERAFLNGHLSYDHSYVMSQLIRHHLLDQDAAHDLRGNSAYDAFLRAWTSGRRAADTPREVAALLDRHAETAVLVDDFHRRLLNESKQTPFL